MEELLIPVVVAAVALYGWLAYRSMRQDQRHELAAAHAQTPGAEQGYLMAARDHYRRLSHWARLFEDLRRDEMVWPLVPEGVRAEVERELAEFYRL